MPGSCCCRSGGRQAGAWSCPRASPGSCSSCGGRSTATCCAPPTPKVRLAAEAAGRAVPLPDRLSLHLVSFLVLSVSASASLSLFLSSCLPDSLRLSVPPCVSASPISYALSISPAYSASLSPPPSLLSSSWCLCPLCLCLTRRPAPYLCTLALSPKDTVRALPGP